MLKEFPKDFLFAGGICSLQTEGGFGEGGKGLGCGDLRKRGSATLNTMNDYDVFADFDPEADYPFQRGVHFYERYKEYIDAMAGMGLKAFRFSICWERIFPNGDDEMPNEEGLQFYDDVLDYMIEKGMEPLVTITHFDTPLMLVRNYNGWLNRKTIDFYVKYCETIFKRYKGKVKYWITFNEINNVVSFPFWCIGLDTRKSENVMQDLYQALHHLFVANALSIKALREIDPDAKIGDMTSVSTIYPYSCNPKEVLTAMQLRRLKYFFIDMQVKGEYPYQMARYFRENNVHLVIEEGDLDIIKANTVDYITCSYYQSAVYKEGELITSDTGGFSSRVKNPYLNATPWGWQIDPVGLRFVLNELYERYHLPILISENGIGMIEELDENKTVMDDYRIEYISDHLKAILEAMDDGVEVFGYTYWGPFDLVSASTCEMKKRYGFVFVDYEDDGSGDGALYKKKSYDWYKKVIETDGKSLFE
ncbi:MAG: glycoside hydrolase family 1 protein [Erysipelotrichaceae bacterium]|nr:glycoside hydrolase family 1 protein [Erysipelotrichaceae bacterium]